MKKTAIFIVSPLVLGIIGALLRAFEFVYGFEEDTGLAVFGSSYRIALYIFAAVCLAAFLFLALSGFSKRVVKSPRIFCRSEKKTALLLYTLSSFLMISAGVVLFIGFINNALLSRAILAMLTVISGCCILALAKCFKSETFSSASALYALVLIFWSCFFVIIFFQENGVDPSVQAYMYDLFCCIAIMFALYSFGRFFFERGSLRMLSFFSMLSVFLMLTARGGRIIASFMTSGRIENGMLDSLPYISLALFFIAVLSSVTATEKRAQDGE